MNKFGEKAPLITQKELEDSILYEDEHILAVNKPGWLVCHPSKEGPWSSLVGACREYLKLDRVHPINRLDRETSGVITIAKNSTSASIYQTAIEHRRVHKHYVALLNQPLKKEIVVSKNLGKDLDSKVHVRQGIKTDNSGQRAETIFTPLFTSSNYTIALIKPITGRKHQIRAHALHIGHPIVGDKIYGNDENYYLEFIEKGWTTKMEAELKLPRQALHAYSLEFLETKLVKGKFQAPLPTEWATFCNDQFALELDDIEKKLKTILNRSS